MALASVRVSSFPSFIQHAWNLCVTRFDALVKLAFLPLLPLLFAIPFVSELKILLQTNAIEDAVLLITPISTILAFAAFIAAAIISITAFAATFIVLAGPKNMTWRAALRLGWKRWVPFVWTQFLVSLILASAVVLVKILTLSPLALHGFIMYLFGFIVILATIIALILAIWFSFAGAIAALGEGSGVQALRMSKDIVQEHFWPVTGLLACWIIFDQVIGRIVSPLPVLSWLTPIVMAFVGTGYIVSVYQSLRNR